MPLNPLHVHALAFRPEPGRDPAIAVTAILTGQVNDSSRQASLPDHSNEVSPACLISTEGTAGNPNQNCLVKVVACSRFELAQLMNW